MKHIYIPIVALAMSLFSGCYTPEPAGPSEPLIREATLAEFNTIVTGPTKVPDAKFNISTYKFPSNMNSSGSLPNDYKYQDGPWEFVEENFPLPDYTTVYTFNEPPNSLLVGDILVDSIYIDNLNAQNSTVSLRFKGKFARMTDNILTDQADTFAKWIKDFRDQNNADVVCRQLSVQAKPFGDISLGSLFSIVATNPKGTPQTYTYPTNWPTATQIGRFLPPFKRVISDDLGSYSAQFKLGDIFYYEAENGVKFFVLVSNIRQGVLPPQLERVTFKFSEAINCIICNPL